MTSFGSFCCCMCKRQDAITFYKYTHTHTATQGLPAEGSRQGGQSAWWRVSEQRLSQGARMTVWYVRQCECIGKYLHSLCDVGGEVCVCVRMCVSVYLCYVNVFFDSNSL